MAVLSIEIPNDKGAILAAEIKEIRLDLANLSDAEAVHKYVYDDLKEKYNNRKARLGLNALIEQYNTNNPPEEL